MKLLLEPCPFCGKDAELKSDGDRDMNATIPYHFVECLTCRARGPKFSEYFKPAEECRLGAVQFWNQRVGETKSCPHPGCCCVCGHQGKSPEDGPCAVDFKGD